MDYFCYEELIYSETALKKRIRNKTSKAIESNLQRLVNDILDPLRRAYGRAILVSSGFRCKEVNQAVGGVGNSQHTTGCAADITAGSRSANRELARLIVSLNLPWCQLINEKDYAWVHISIENDPKTSPKRQILYYNGKTYKNITPDQL